ncbi:MAG: hypothetical protein ACR2P4_07090 [Gammaproteobacteria bacterium]
MDGNNRKEQTMNTLAMTDKLQAAGVPEKQARAHIEVLQDATGGLATTADIQKMMAQLRAELKADMAQWRADLAVLLLKVTIGSLVAATAIFSFVVKTLLTVG